MCLEDGRLPQVQKDWIVYKLAILKGGVPVSAFCALNKTIGGKPIRYIPGKVVKSSRKSTEWMKSERSWFNFFKGLHFFANEAGSKMERSIILHDYEGTIWRDFDGVYLMLRCKVKKEDVVAVGEFDLFGKKVKSLVATKAEVIDVVDVFARGEPELVKKSLSDYRKLFREKKWMKATKKVKGEKR